MSDLQLQAEITLLAQKLRSIGEHGRKASKAAFQEAGGILIAAIQARAPVSDKVHYRYSTPKISGKARAPKGSGRRVASYAPGNLKRSFKVLPFRRTNAVFIGPKVAKGNATGSFVGVRTDAYYAGMVEAGTRRTPARRFVAAAEQAAGGQTLRFAAELIRRQIQFHAKTKGL